MNNQIDLSNYSSEELLKMLKEKQKEYIILTQSEKITRALLEYYGKKLYTGEYHSRINNEFYLLLERAMHKNLINNKTNNDISVNIPLYSIIRRLDESKNELLNKNYSFCNDYSLIVDDLVNKLNDGIIYYPIIYINGDLYVVKDDEEILIDDNYFTKLMDDELFIQKRKTLQNK